jgi:glycosyltransferase involved in cell wall biosynthesis
VVPRVSIVIPARNEARHIEACVRSVMAQEIGEAFEVIVVDGDSDDSTAELARAAGARVVPNPERTIPAALNRGLHAAAGEILVRFDAHAEMPPGYVAASLRGLAEEDGVANVGGWREVVGEGPWARATGEALTSRLGVGNPRIWKRPREDEPRHEVDTVPLGCFRVETLRRLGGWRPDLLRNEDFELNERLRNDGGRIVFDPAVWSVYHPRESLVGLAKQYWAYGQYKARVLADAPYSLRPRQLAPVALLAAMVGAAAPTAIALPSRVALGAYGLVLAGASARSREGWRTGIVLGTMHLTWAAGLVAGFAGVARERIRRPDPGA